MIVFSEAQLRREDSASARDLQQMATVAELCGCRVYPLPPELSGPDEAEAALEYVPDPPVETAAVWIGYIPAPEQYRWLYEAAQRKRIRLLNTPAEHLIAQEFDRSYPLLGDLTPESVVLTSENDIPDAAARLGLPLFVKGAVQSRKAKGWKACVAHSAEELSALTASLLRLENRSRGRVIARRLVPLRHSRTSPQGFPFGREYRLFIYRNRVLAYGYYWEGDDPLRALSSDEERTVLNLGQEAARRLGTPYVAVDVGQAEDGRWLVIETGDAQFSGLSQVSRFRLWSALTQL